MSSFTACVITGIVMMNITRRTSRTSITASCSFHHRLVFAAATNTHAHVFMTPAALSARGHIGFGDETDSGCRSLAQHHHACDVLIRRGTVATNMDFRLRIHHGNRLQALEQRFLRRDHRRFQ